MSLRIGHGLSVKFSVVGLALLAGYALALVTSYSTSVRAGEKLPPPVITGPQDGYYAKGGLLHCRSWAATQGMRYNYESYHNSTLTAVRTSPILSSNQLCNRIDGDFTFWWRVRLVDADGRTGEWSEVRKVIVDSTPPVASLSLLADRTQNNFSSGAVRVNASVSSAEKNLATHEFEVVNPDGSTVQIDPVTATSHNHTFALDTSHGDGEYTVRYTAVDKAGNRSQTIERKVTVDNTAPNAPVLSVDGLPSGSATSATSVTVQWSAPSADTASYEYRHRADGEADWQVSATADTQYVQPLDTDTTYRIQVRAIDLAGNVSEWSPELIVVRETTPPVAPAQPTLTPARPSTEQPATPTADTGDGNQPAPQPATSAAAVAPAARVNSAVTGAPDVAAADDATDEPETASGATAYDDTDILAQSTMDGDDSEVKGASTWNVLGINASWVVTSLVSAALLGGTSWWLLAARRKKQAAELLRRHSSDW